MVDWDWKRRPSLETQTSNITEDNKLIKCGALVITQLLGTKEINKKKEEHSGKEEFSQNNALRKDVSLIERWEKGMVGKESQKTRLDHL